MIEWSRHLLTGGMKIEEKLEKSTVVSGFSDLVPSAGPILQRLNLADFLIF